MVWLIRFEVTVREILKVEIFIKLLRQQKIPKISIFKGWHFVYYSSESNNPKHLLKELIKMFQMHLKQWRFRSMA